MIPARKYRLWALLGFGSALYFFANLQRVAVPGAIFDSLQSELQLDAPQVTALGSSFMYVYALNQLLVGFLVARYGGRRVITAGALFFCLGGILFPLSGSFSLLCFSRVLTGLGASVIYLSLISETVRTFPRNYSIMVSIVIMIGYAGGIMANAPFVAGAEALGWRTMLLLIGLATLFAYLAFTGTGLTLKKTPVRLHAAKAAHYLRLLKNSNNLTIFLFGGINFGLYYVLQTVIGKKFLEDFCTFSGTKAAWILSLMGAISAAAGVLFAFLSRLSGNRRKIFCRIPGVTGTAVFLTAALLILAGNGNSLFALLFCLLSLTASTSSILIPLLYETNPSGLGEQAVSLMNFSFYFFVALFGNLAGRILQLHPPLAMDGMLIYPRESYLTLFIVLGCFSLLSLICSMRIRDKAEALPLPDRSTAPGSA